MISSEERRKWDIPEDPGSLTMAPLSHHTIFPRIIAGQKMYVKIQDFKDGRQDFLHIVYAVPLYANDGIIFFQSGMYSV